MPGRPVPGPCKQARDATRNQARDAANHNTEKADEESDEESGDATRFPAHKSPHHTAYVASGRPTEGAATAPSSPKAGAPHHASGIGEASCAFARGGQETPYGPCSTQATCDPSPGPSASPAAHEPFW